MNVAVVVVKIGAETCIGPYRCGASGREGGLVSCGSSVGICAGVKRGCRGWSMLIRCSVEGSNSARGINKRGRFGGW